MPRFTIVLVILALTVAPLTADAQRYRRSSVATTTPYDTTSTSDAQIQRVRGWRGSSELQQKISDLGSTIVEDVPIPILFGVTLTNISPNFGDPRTNHPHRGEDLLAPKGTPIVSPTAAVVIRTEVGGTEGNAVYTANPGGETFVYYHLDRWAEGLASGQLLQPGSLIGYVGDTGDAAGGPSHLHFEIHESSRTPVDPFPRLSVEFTPAQKILFLNTILTQTADATALARLLVTEFRGTFLAAQALNIELPSVIVSALASIPASTPRSGTSTSLPPGDLDLGSTGAAVVALQQHLIRAASGPAAASLTSAGATGTFGPVTKAALVEYQRAMGISPASGYYGPLTRAYVESHPASSAPGTPPSPTTTTTPAPTPPGGSPVLARDLSLGMTGDDVRALQQFLNGSGYPIAVSGAGSPGNETTYFGPATQAAVITFQAAKNISPAAGYVGPLTRAAIASL